MYFMYFMYWQPWLMGRRARSHSRFDFPDGRRPRPLARRLRIINPLTFNINPLIYKPFL